MARIRLSAFLLCTLLCAITPALSHADPAADLAKSSIFSSVDLNSLASGTVLCPKGTSLANSRDLAVQSLYLVHAPVAATVQLHQQWDAARHSELNVYLHHDFSTHPSIADFSLPLPGNSAVHRLADATARLPALGDLQLSKAEAGSYKAGQKDFWSQLIFHRATAFLSRGFSGQPPYEFSGTVRVGEEVSRLMAEQPKVRAAFGPVISHSPLGGGAGSLPLSPYWELFDAEGQANYSLGAAASTSVADGAQMVDVIYYASGDYYAYVTLYQMYPVTVAGKPATLVWRVDSISSQSLSDLTLMDRMASGSAMRADILRMVNFFKKDTGK